MKTKFVIKSYSLNWSVEATKKREPSAYKNQGYLYRDAYKVSDRRVELDFVDLYVTDMDCSRLRVGDKFYIEHNLLENSCPYAFTIHEVWFQENAQIYVVNGDYCINSKEANAEFQKCREEAEAKDNVCKLEYQVEFERIKGKICAPECPEEQKPVATRYDNKIDKLKDSLYNTKFALNFLRFAGFATLLFMSMSFLVVPESRHIPIILSMITIGIALIVNVIMQGETESTD
jgi:hypothetical protein